MKQFTPTQLALIHCLADGKPHSGPFLAKHLRVSRTAIWKQIGQLIEWGLSIKRIPQQGYQWETPVILLEKNKIIANRTSIDLHLFAEIDSTNRYLRELNPSPNWTVCCAEKQTQGRGRFGRTWHSPFGDNIYFSVRIPWQDCLSKLSGLSLMVSLSVLTVLKKNQLEEGIAIKWPNDLLWQDKKLAGILIEMTAESHDQCQIIIGIGMNVNAKPHSLPLTDKPWCSLYEITGRAFDRNQLIADFITTLQQSMTRFKQEGFAGFEQDWKPVDYLYGKTITITLPTEKQTGIAKGVNALGQLLLEDDQGLLVAIASGEASVGRFAPG